MIGKHGALCAAVLIGLSPAPAAALCSYNGKLYARTTIAEEFHDARYVAEVKVISGTAAYADEPDRRFVSRWGEEGSVALFRLRVLRAYKGRPPPTIRFFSERNSGGFYFERAWRDVAPSGTPGSFYVGPDLATDVGGRYLVFLNPIEPHRGMGAQNGGPRSSTTPAGSRSHGGT